MTDTPNQQKAVARGISERISDRVSGKSCTVLGYGISNRPLCAWLVSHAYLAPVWKYQDGEAGFELVSKKRFSTQEADQALALCQAYNQAGATVTGVKKKKDTLAPGKLYSEAFPAPSA